MGLIEQHIIRTLVPPIIGACTVLAVVMTAFYTAQTLMDAVTLQYPLSSVVIFTLLRLGIFLDLMLPMALCAGIILGLGQLYAHHEITAVMAAGVGPGRILAAVLVPVLIGALLVAACTMLLRPAAFQALYDLESRLAVRVDLDRVEPGRFVPFGSNWLIRARERRDGNLRDVLVQHRSNSEIELLRAGNLAWGFGDDNTPRLVFSEGVERYRFAAGGRAKLLGHFETFHVILEPPQPPRRQRLRRAYSFTRLTASDDPEHAAEWQWRMLAPLSTLLLALVCVPLSRVNARQTRGSRLVAGALMIAIYFSLLGTAVHWLESGHVPVWIGIWWVPALLAALCLPAGARYLNGES